MPEEAQIDVTAVSRAAARPMSSIYRVPAGRWRVLGFRRGDRPQAGDRYGAGAARLAADSDESLAVLRERVTSKGGTTAAALASLRPMAFRRMNNPRGNAQPRPVVVSYEQLASQD